MKKKEMLNKEDVVDYLLNLKLNKIILISSVSSNLDYYYNILEQRKSEYEARYINLASNSELELTGVNIEIIEFLKNSKKTILFLDLNLALRVFFDEVRYKDLSKNEEYEREDLKKFFIENGYKESYIVQNKGEYGIRGDIIDIFPANLDDPIRLDFFDTILENIKVFSSYDQRSIENIEDVRIFANSLNGLQREIVQMIKLLSGSNIEIFLENKELLDFKLEQIVMIDKDNTDVLKKRYDNLLENSNLLEVSKNKDRNYQDEIREKKKALSRKGIKYNSVNQILEEDYVIHVEFGIGKYKGIVNINDRDYLYIQYADNDKLYIPVEKLDRISKYVYTGNAPQLYSLGTKGFKRKEKRLKEDIEKFAKELLEIQARRHLLVKPPFEKDTVWQEEFEEKFPFNLTIDQKRAIDDIKNDL